MTSTAPVGGKCATLAGMQPTRAVLRALLARRRIVPLGILGAMLVAAETWSVPDLRITVYSTLLYTAFVILAPLSWTALGATTAGRVLHGAAGVLCTLVFGIMLRRMFGLPVTLLTDPTGLVAITGGFWVGGYTVGRDIQLERALGIAERNAESAKRVAEHAQLLALRAHLEPHFLFNTLNAIAEWCRESPEVAEQATLRLAAMLRAILEAVSYPTWPMSRELSLVEDLLALYAVRDSARFSLSLSVEEGVRTTNIPPLLVLAIVENAVKHGPGAGHRGKIELEAHFDAEGSVHVAVSNPGRYAGPRIGGEGLSLLRKRVEHAYGGRARFAIEAISGFTVATLVVPAHGGTIV